MTEDTTHLVAKPALKKKTRIKNSLGDTGRNIGANYNDRYKRETILISAHARNLGL